MSRISPSTHYPIVHNLPDTPSSESIDCNRLVIGVHDRLPKIASEYGVSSVVQSRAYELAALAEDTGIANGRNPRGVAAACLYLAGEEHDAGYTQSGLAAAADVSAATVGYRAAELRERREDDYRIE